MKILEKILITKKQEVAFLKKEYSYNFFEQQKYFGRDTISLQKLIQQTNTTKIIAEFKRQSPSKGSINSHSSVIDVTSGYQNNGAVAISILTDEQYFGGTNKDILTVRDSITIPILRKDFIINEIQLLEAKAIGADIVLLIASCLSPKGVKDLSSFAKSLHLEVLLELHSEKELDHICDTVDFIGVNNRNLNTFEVDLQQSIDMCSKIPDEFIKIAESGLHTVENIDYLSSFGFDAFLIGELFMKNEKPDFVFEKFIKMCNHEN